MAKFRLKEPHYIGYRMLPAGHELDFSEFNGQRPSMQMEPLDDEAREMFAKAMAGKPKDILGALMQTAADGTPAAQMARQNMAMAEQLAASLVEKMAPQIAAAIADQLVAAGMMGQKPASPEEIAAAVKDALKANSKRGAAPAESASENGGQAA